MFSPKQMAITKLFEKYGNLIQTRKPEVEYFFAVRFQTSSFFFSVEFKLPPNFPDEAPTFKVDQRLVHPIISDDFSIHEPKLASWSSHKDICAVIESIYQEFKAEKPVPSKRGVMKYAVTAPKELEDINTKDEDVLNLLLNDEQMFQDWFSSFKNVTEQVNNLSSYITGDIEMVTVLECEKTREESLRSEVARLKSEYTRKKYELDYSGGHTSHGTIEELERAVRDADRQSESIAERFINQEISQQDFVKQYKEARKLYHVRNAKFEMLKKNLTE
eukprot:c8159_g1_i1.p1 GENE.c8159_g1_i1~~c8159_g1_i1.p1  ORF type:complete len:283 (+),score=89.40 c8159_g1_i1:27-851(+)